MKQAPSTDGTNSLWVVEMWINEPRMKKQWVPTTGVSLCRESGRVELDEWKERNCGRFRLARYRRIT